MRSVYSVMVLALGLVLSACVAQAPAEVPEAADVPAVAQPLGAGENTVIVGSWQEGIFYNVLYTQGGGSLSVAKQAQRGLLFLDETSNYVGELALEVPTLQNGGISEDGLTITYKLREGVTWHDGTPVTSADVKATWDMIMNPENAVITRFGYDKIESIETPDDYTVVLHFAEPFASWPILFDAIIAKHVIEANSPGLDKSEAMRVPLGFGPFRMVEWVTGDYVRFEAFDGYWRGRPQIDTLVVRNYPSVDALVQAVEAGEVDIAWSLPLSFVPKIRDLESQGVVLFSTQDAGAERYHMNPADPLFADLRVRQALQHAVDKQAIIDNLLFGLAKPGISEWSGSQWENPNLAPYVYDVEKCRNLMEEAGWVMGADGVRVKDGERLFFTHTTTSGNLLRENVQLVVQQMFADCGVEMTIANGRSAELFGNWSQNGTWSHGDYQMGGWSHGLRVPDPEVSNRLLCSEVASDANPAGSQWYRYCNPAVDKLLQTQAQEFDPEARRQLIWQVQELVHADAYTIFLYTTVTSYAVNAGLHNFVLHPFANYYWNSHEWSLK